MLMVKGWASTSAIDADGYSFEPDAIRWPSFKGGLTPPIELLYRHDPYAPAGKIRTLERRATPDGGVGLWCEATVDPYYTQLPFTGFSVGIARIERYEIKQGFTGPYASIASAILSEVSLALEPRNPECIIQSREEWNEITPHLIAQINKLRTLQRLVEQAMRANK